MGLYGYNLGLHLGLVWGADVVGLTLLSTCARSIRRRPRPNHTRSPVRCLEAWSLCHLRGEPWDSVCIGLHRWIKPQTLESGNPKRLGPGGVEQLTEQELGGFGGIKHLRKGGNMWKINISETTSDRIQPPMCLELQFTGSAMLQA